MVWVKVTDKHPREARKAGLSPQARTLHMDALCWIMENDNETTRITPRDLVRLSEQDDPEKIVPELLKCGWWVEHPDGGWVVIHDMDVQRTFEQIRADRDKGLKRITKYRAACNGVTAPGGNEGPAPVVTPKGVTTKNAGDGITGATPDDPGQPPQGGQQTLGGSPVKAGSDGEPDLVRADVEALCTHLADRVEANGSLRPTIGQRWRDAARLLLDRDHRDPAKAHALIDWCQDNSFWRSNIRSMVSFRDQFDAIRLRALADWEKKRAANGNGVPVSPRQAATDALFERAWAEAAAADAAEGAGR
jgi:hypothetical protein